MTAKKEDLANLPDWPRLLSPEQAAAYCGLSTGTFSEHIPVKPLRLGKRVLYDRRLLDRVVDAWSGINRLEHELSPEDWGEENEWLKAIREQADDQPRRKLSSGREPLDKKKPRKRPAWVPEDLVPTLGADGKLYVICPCPDRFPPHGLINTWQYLMHIIDKWEEEGRYYLAPPRNGVDFRFQFSDLFGHAGDASRRYEIEVIAGPRK